MAQQLSARIRNFLILRSISCSTGKTPSVSTYSSSAAAAATPELEKGSDPQTVDPPEKGEESLSLYKRLSRLGGRPVNTKEVLDKWVKEGHEVKNREFEAIVYSFRRFGDYKRALQISEWMDGIGGLQLGMRDYAIRLDMIGKVRGIAAAENYFKELPESSKNQQTYGALLNSYVREQMTEKAEGLMEKIKELGFARKALPYNNMMTLYYKTGQPQKVLSVIQEMKAADIMPDTFTYKIWMNTYAALSDIKGVEKVFDEMKLDGRFKNDWSIYSNLSVIYIEAGLVEKAEDSLKKTEKRISMKNDRMAYDTLILMYAKFGNKVEVYRLWQKLSKTFPKMTNTNYMCIMSSLVKLKDIEGVEKCFNNWESEGLICDMRVPNILIGAYITEGMIKKAELLLNRVQKKGFTPNFKTWEMFVDGYLQSKQTEQAIEAMKKAISRVQYRESQPAPDKALAVLRLFESSGDVDGAEDMFKSLRGVDHVSIYTYNSLLRTYIKAGKSPSKVIERMELDRIEPDEETVHLGKQIVES